MQNWGQRDFQTDMQKWINLTKEIWIIQGETLPVIRFYKQVYNSIYRGYKLQLPHL